MAREQEGLVLTAAAAIVVSAAAAWPVLPAWMEPADAAAGQQPWLQGLDHPLMPVAGWGSAFASLLPASHVLLGMQSGTHCP
jgi:hypothetical protein